MRGKPVVYRGRPRPGRPREFGRQNPLIRCKRKLVDFSHSEPLPLSNVYQLQEALQKAGIDPLWQVWEQFSRVMVPLKDLERARAILRGLNAGTESKM